MNSVKTCEILIVGAGPAGLSAALSAAPSGFNIVIVDDNPLPGGQIWRDGKGAVVPSKAKSIQSQLAQFSNVQWLQGTKVISAIPADQQQRFSVVLENAETSWIQQARHIILCTGGRERLLPFSGWTLPGVTGAGGLQALIKSGMPVVGQRIIIGGTGPLLLAAAKTAKQAGADVIYIAEQTSRYRWWHFGLSLWQWPTKILQAIRLLSLQLHCASYIKSVRLRGGQLLVTIQQDNTELDLECDRLASGYGIMPNTEMAELLGCRLTSGNEAIEVNQFMQTSVPNVYAAGEGTGFGGSDKAMVEGQIAGLHAVHVTDTMNKLHRQRQRWLKFAQLLQQDFTLIPEIRTIPRNNTIVCRCEDVRYDALIGRESWIDAKLHTRCGMGPCQGKICGVACETLFGWQSVPQRHLLSPVRVETLAQYALTDKHE